MKITKQIEIYKRKKSVERKLRTNIRTERDVFLMKNGVYRVNRQPYVEISTEHGLF